MKPTTALRRTRLGSARYGQQRHVQLPRAVPHPMNSCLPCSGQVTTRALSLEAALLSTSTHRMARTTGTVPPRSHSPDNADCPLPAVTSARLESGSPLLVPAEGKVEGGAVCARWHNNERRAMQLLRRERRLCRKSGATLSESSDAVTMLRIEASASACLISSG